MNVLSLITRDSFPSVLAAFEDLFSKEGGCSLGIPYMILDIPHALQLTLHIYGFHFHGFNQLRMENTRKKYYIVADIYYIVRPTMVAVLHLY